MDMAFVNAVNRSESFPPHDPWMSGESLNYYYFGHYVVALLIRATGIDPASGFNLGVALFYALTASALFAVAATLALSRGVTTVAKATLAGVVTVLFALVLGNLAGRGRASRRPSPAGPVRLVVAVARHRRNGERVPVLQLSPRGSPRSRDGDALRARLSSASRCSSRSQGLAAAATLGRLALAAGELVLAALVLGSLYAVNSLDFPTALLLVLGGAVLWLTRPGVEGIGRALVWLPLLAFTALALFAPFIVRYTPDAAGLALVRERDSFTRFAADIALIYALPLWIIAAALAHRLAAPFRYVAWSAVAVLVLLVAARSRTSGGPLRRRAARGRRVARRSRQATDPAGALLLAARRSWACRSSRSASSRTSETTSREPRATASTQSSRRATRRGSCWRSSPGVASSGRAAGSGGRCCVRGRSGSRLLVALLAVYPVAGSYARTNGFSGEPTLDGDALARGVAAGRCRSDPLAPLERPRLADDPRGVRPGLQSSRATRGSRRSPGSRP